MARPKKPEKDRMQILLAVRVPTALVRQVDVRVKEWTKVTGFAISRGEAVRAALRMWLEKSPHKA